MKKLLIGLLFLNMALYSFSQEYTISGYMEDAISGEKLISANVFDYNSSKGTITNTFGFYSLTLPADTVNLSFSYIGFQTQDVNFVLTKDTILNIKLGESVELETVEISAERSKRIEEESQMSTIEVPIAQIKKIPALLGEVDVLKALQLLPGVQSGGEGQSGLYVRGGSPDQNLILLDGVPVYNASHLLGFFSVFNAYAIKDVKLIKGGFPARYGGRLSSVIEINMKEGDNKEIRGAASIGLISSKLTIEGPIRNENTSFILSGRRTYIDLLAKPFISRGFEEDGQDGGTGYYFYDLNAKINHRFSDRDRLYLSTYLGKDRFYFESKDNSGEFRDFIDTDLGWGNVTTALRWNHLMNPKLFMNLTATYSQYELNTGSGFGTEILSSGDKEEISINYISGINDWALKLDFDYLPNPDHFIRFGVNGIYHDFKPGVFNLREEDTATNYSFSSSVGQDDIDAQEYALYVEDDMKLNEAVKLNAGIHVSAFNVQGKWYGSFQPRLSGRYLFDNDLSIKGSFSTMRQYVHLLAYEGIGLPTDLWLPTTERVKPQDAWQVAVGAAKTFNNEYEFSVEGYYKKMSNVISYLDGSGLFEFSDWQDRVAQGDGESYGTEFFIQKKRGRLSGWLGYTLSWSYRQFDEINFGERYPYRYDRRHDFSLVANYQWTDRISLAGSWVYGTGNAVTLANSNYIGAFNGQNFEQTFGGSFFEERNNFRMSAYHRLDVGINFTRQRKHYKRTWSIGAYNTYNRKNPFFIYEDFDSNGEFKLKQASLFPIIPYVTFNVEF